MEERMTPRTAGALPPEYAVTKDEAEQLGLTKRDAENYLKRFLAEERKSDEAMWAKGDLLLEVEPMAERGVNPGVGARLRWLAEKLDTSRATLAYYRGTAAQWPREYRVQGVSWAVHRVLAYQADRFDLIHNPPDGGWSDPKAKVLIRERALADLATGKKKPGPRTKTDEQRAAEALAKAQAAVEKAAAGKDESPIDLLKAARHKYDGLVSLSEGALLQLNRAMPGLPDDETFERDLAKINRVKNNLGWIEFAMRTRQCLSDDAIREVSSSNDPDRA